MIISRIIKYGDLTLLFYTKNRLTLQTKRDMANEIVETIAIEQVSDRLYKGVSDIIDNARQEVVVYVNKHSDLMFWHIGHYINEDMGYKQYSAYGSRILATLSQRLTARYGKGYTYTAVTRMMKVARFYSDEEMFATLSQTLTWSHFLELVTICLLYTSDAADD